MKRAISAASGAASKRRGAVAAPAASISPARRSKPAAPACDAAAPAPASAAAAAPAPPSPPPGRRRGGSAPIALAYDAAPGASSAAAAAPAPAAAAAASAALSPVEAPPTSPARGWGKPAEPHAGWRVHLAHIKAMRAPGGAAHPAAVDSMGCERCADPSAPAPVQRFQTLVSLMLSSQTKDEVTYAACQRLKGGLGPLGFTPAGCAAAPLATLEALIHPVGFFRNKAKFVQAAGAACRDGAHGAPGDIPASVEALCRLKGVGPKMAFIAMASAWGKSVGIGVDTHVHRIANRLQWVKTDSPQQTQAHLQAFLPREEWDALNLLLVGFGQALCTPLAPRCGDCANSAFCPLAAGKAASLAACAATEAK